jgi:glutaminase
MAAAKPHKFSIAVWSQELNEKGNSVKAILALELWTDKLKFSLF